MMIYIIEFHVIAYKGTLMGGKHEIIQSDMIFIDYRSYSYKRNMNNILQKIEVY